MCIVGDSYRCLATICKPAADVLCAQVEREMRTMWHSYLDSTAWLFASSCFFYVYVFHHMYSVVQCVAVCCSVLQCVAVWWYVFHMYVKSLCDAPVRHIYSSWLIHMYSSWLIYVYVFHMYVKSLCDAPVRHIYIYIFIYTPIRHIYIYMYSFTPKCVCRVTVWYIHGIYVKHHMYMSSHCVIRTRHICASDLMWYTCGDFSPESGP